MKTNHIIFTSLCLMFVLYSFSIYVQPVYSTASAEERAAASEGKLVWQKYNCQSCHQLYGLGGYLGPDLTNVHSEKGKGPDYIRAFVRGGTAQMPAFVLTQEEELRLLDFLEAADRSGSADPRLFRISYSGMIEKK